MIHVPAHFDQHVQIKRTVRAALAPERIEVQHPGIRFTFSSIRPVVGLLGSRLIITGPCELLPIRFNNVISVGTSSRPLASVSAARPVAGSMSTLTWVGPATITRSTCPLG